MAEPDHYAVLGVARYAPGKVVRRAYLQLMARHHPDRPTSQRLSDVALSRINAAYWELRHPERRARYDAGLHAGEARALRRRAHRDARRWQRFMRQPRLTPLLFVATMIAVAAGVYLAVEERARLRAQAQLHRLIPREPAASASPSPSPIDVPQPAAAAAPIDAAIRDYPAIRTQLRRAGTMNFIDRCFGELAAVATPAGFDYCVAFEAMAAHDPSLWRGATGRRLTRRSRLRRLAGVALPPAGTLARWQFVDGAVDRHERCSRIGSACRTGAQPGGMDAPRDQGQ